MKARLLWLAISVTLTACASRQPRTSITSTTPDESWRFQRPQDTPARPFTPPVAIEFLFPNGLRLLLVENHRLPLVAVRVVSRIGAAAAPSDRQGVADVVLGAMRRSAGSLSAVDLADAFAGLGSRLAANVALDESDLAVDVERDRVEPALALLSEIVLRPRLDAEATAQARDELLARIRSRYDSGAELAADRLRQQIYGDQHPYGWPEGGVLQTVNSIDREDVTHFYRAAWRPEEVAIVLVGDIALDAATALLRPSFGSWRPAVTPSDARYLKRSSPATDHSRYAVTLIDKQGTQAAVSVGHLGIRRSDPDWSAVDVLNRILGGGFASRLNLDLSEEKGYCYNIRSRITESVDAGQFLIRASIATDKVGLAVADIVRHVQRITQERPTSDEVDAAKNAALGIAVRLDTNAKIAEEVGHTFAYGLPFDHLIQDLSHIRAVTVEGVHAVARRHLAADRLNIVIVGPASVIEAQLHASGLAPIERQR